MDPGRDRDNEVSGSTIGEDTSIDKTGGTREVVLAGGLKTGDEFTPGILESLKSDPEGLPGFKYRPEPAPRLADLLRGCCCASSFKSSNMDEHFLLRVEFQWFLIALSVRPLRRRAMVAHLLPIRAWALMIVSSSSALNGLCSTSGDSWLHHRNLHDFPDRPGIDLLIRDQFLGP